MLGIDRNDLMGCRVSCYSELEEISLHDGVFFERAHAEAYVGMFTPRLELIDKDKLNSDPRSETFLSATPLFSLELRLRIPLPVENRVDRHSLMQRYRARKRPRRASEVEAVGQKVRVDGFQLQLPRRFAPDSSPVADAIR